MQALAQPDNFQWQDATGKVVARACGAGHAAFRDAFMNRSEKDQLTDEIIGEAVLSLLREKGPINMRVLIARLRSMETSESDPQRREAIARVITEISSTTVSERRNGAHERKEWNGDNVRSLFGDSQSPDGTKKH